MNAFAPVLDHSISRPCETAVLRVLSLGAGVQSVTLAHMSARGELPMLDAAFFADTGDEKRATYRHLDWLQDQLPFPLIRVRRPGPTLAELTLAVARGERPHSGSPLPPLYLRDPDGMAAKQCNAEFKRDVVTRAVRALMKERSIKLKRGQPIVEMWVGFSTDELERLADHRKQYIQHRFPLIERRMNRHDCKRWLELRQLPIPPKSSCVYCPYQGDGQWLDMKENEADDDWQRAVMFDEGVRPYHAGATGTAYVHRSGRPLAEVKLERLPDLFLNDCSGHCGT